MSIILDLFMSFKSYYSLILLSILSISCSEDGKINIGSDIEKYTFVLAPQEPETSFSRHIDDTIGITVYIAGSHVVYSGYINRQYKSNGNGTFVPASEEDEILHPLGDQSLDFIAYYPSKRDLLTSYYPISLSDQSNKRATDLLYSNNAKNKTNTSGNIAFVFNHALSKIVINTTISTSGNLVTEDLQGMNITINGVHDEGLFNLADGSIETTAPKSSIQMKTGANGRSSEAIILPGATTGISFIIKLANGYTYSATLPNGEQFLSGHIYTYNITISQIGIILHPISIADWVVINDIPQEEIADEIVYKTGDFYPNPGNPNTAIGVVYWLKPGTGGKEGKIVSFDSALKNWGDSYNQNLGTNISTGIINWDIIMQNDPTMERFPAFKWCKDKGNGWYLPSRYELHVLQELWLTHGESMNQNIELIKGEPFTFNDVYLASSESRSWPNDRAETYYFSTKNWLPIYKSAEGRIRAVREF